MQSKCKNSKAVLLLKDVYKILPFYQVETGDSTQKVMFYDLKVWHWKYICSVLECISKQSPNLQGLAKIIKLSHRGAKKQLFLRRSDTSCRKIRHISGDQNWNCQWQYFNDWIWGIEDICMYDWRYKTTNENVSWMMRDVIIMVIVKVVLFDFDLERKYCLYHIKVNQGFP